MFAGWDNAANIFQGMAISGFSLSVAHSGAHDLERLREIGAFPLYRLQNGVAAKGDSLHAIYKGIDKNILPLFPKRLFITCWRRKIISLPVPGCTHHDPVNLPKNQLPVIHSIALGGQHRSIGKQIHRAGQQAKIPRQHIVRFDITGHLNDQVIGMCRS